MNHAHKFGILECRKHPNIVWPAGPIVTSDTRKQNGVNCQMTLIELRTESGVKKTEKA